MRRNDPRPQAGGNASRLHGLHPGRSRLVEAAAKALFLLAACVSVAAVALICAFLFANGAPALFQIGPGNFLLGTTWRPGNDLYGIFPMILGSLYVTAGAIALGVPIGLLTAVYLSRFASRRTARLLKPAVDLLAGIPSVVYGFFGMMVLVPLVRELFGGDGMSILTASVLLGIMILPTIITVSRSALDAVPAHNYEGALVLGEFAVSAGWCVPEVVLYMAFVALSNFAQPSFELGYAFKILRVVLIILVAFFNLWGLIGGVVLIALLLATTKTVTGQCYLYPLIPFNGPALLGLLIRRPISNKNC